MAVALRIAERQGRRMTLAEINRMIRAAIGAARQEGASEVQVVRDGTTVRIPLVPDAQADKEVAQDKDIVL